ncbi:Carboxylesterase type B [Penicillium robsamsonii]|uniref:Carboxylesterase type B n=1 Tax=Penicillium robsamsonii TaxID=1792511 RepID=UPI0025492C58|nr:Carboxylesterase type B [Penicillium robsamsonii]KAJ5822856.1 Carboxylesterase type B [Penicillium robsamsonii]
MANRLFASVVAVLLAIIAIYYQELCDTFFLSSSIKVVDSARGISYLGSLSPVGVEHFQNIFYAEEPTGQRRFAPPVPTRPVKGSVIDATRAGAWCPQATGDILPFTSRVTNISENCLSLRIARLAGTQEDAKLPVAVWIHGGGHVLGSASDILYEPDGLVNLAAADGQPLVYVGINYRLGLFGFATSEALIERKDTNAGLRDQRVALEWVRDNIESFGGDPNRVTVIGQSVGASDIGLQLTAFGGDQDVPFQQGVMMSGGPGLNFNSHPDLVASHTAAIAQQVGCGSNQDLQTLECLRGVPFERLANLSVTASRAARPPLGEGYFYPTIDDDFIQDRPSELTREGKFTKGIPLIASWVTNDGAWYAPPTTATDDEVLGSFGLWLHKLSQSTKEKLLHLYPLEDFEHMIKPEHEGQLSPQYYRAAQLNRDIWFTCPVLDFTWQYVKNGGVEASQVRLFEFNQTRYMPVFDFMGVSMWGVAHLSDIPYLFNNDHLGAGADNSDAQLALARDFSRTIIQFVHGTPKGSDDRLQSWPPAFSNELSKSSIGDLPSHISVQLFGGPHGSAPTRCSEGIGAGMEVMTDAEKALHWEKLFSRCAFLNGQQFREEAGV